ncbi:hypothetical protein H0E87_023280 [Populus deltoides]|uniref:CRC domain-containing protein n=1 Tax=Populus deltoides TaxID=3696 RepID=A0A8T2XFZ4_POPDE|nr:hypothetical protein H0E87_023280 [Populus deltoides]
MGAHKKKLAFESNSSSTSSQLDHNGAYLEKHAAPRRTEKGKTLSALSGRGIGLHLNALTAACNGKAVKIETRASVKQEISEPPSPATKMTSGQDPAIKSIALTTVQTNFVPFDNKNKTMENAPHASMVVNEEFGISSPNMKRQKLENQGASRKRCNCKRSKCLKLYCECFAAGLYCIEPCSCLDCFNNPGHEGTVLETRGQIESRNPLAFAPKVIRNLDSASEFRVRNAFRVVLVALPTVDAKDVKTLLVARVPKYEKHLKVIPEDETPEILNSNSSPTSEVKSVSPNCPRVSPPHHGFGSSASWMILRSLNPSPSLNPSSEQ